MDRAYRAGFCDGIMQREYKNPYAFKEIHRMWGYFNGYVDGKQKMAQEAK